MNVEFADFCEVRVDHRLVGWLEVECLESATVLRWVLGVSLIMHTVLHTHRVARYTLFSSLEGDRGVQIIGSEAEGL